MNKYGIKEETWAGIMRALRESSVKRAILFGSRARGDYRDNSDVDIAVEWEGEEGYGALMGRLEEVVTALKFDIVDLGGISEEGFRGAIFRDGVELLGR